MYAYSELYLDDAMCSMGEMFDYVINDCCLDGNLFYDVFCTSPICRQFEAGNPKYISGRSGVELARDIWNQMTGERLMSPPSFALDRSEEYRAGWALAYYQWFRTQRFFEIKKEVLDFQKPLPYMFFMKRIFLNLSQRQIMLFSVIKTMI